jgi:teichuronic acid biosynthesis glycosyltransferase TuaH
VILRRAIVTDDIPRRAEQPLFDVICCSLEPWDEVWRRNQLLTTELLVLRPTMRVLFAELPVDVTWSLLHGRRRLRSGVRPVGSTGRLWAMAPRKWLPRRIRPDTDRALGRQILRAGRRLGFDRPVLWINDNTYADLAITTDRPTVYDVTDDWVLGWNAPREAARQRRNDSLLLENADEVVVCSPALSASRGRHRPVHLIPNAVDVEHMRRPQGRPPDLPDGTVVLYQGTLNDGRLDIDLCIAVAERLAGRATLVFVGPSSLSDTSTERLHKAGAVLLGSRPYATMPGYLQHADVLVVPHLATPFIESLDPIKAREFQAVARPTVSTPVAGFRDLGPPITTAPADRFVDEVIAVLDRGPLPPGPGPLTSSPATWTERAKAFLEVLDAANDARAGRAQRSTGSDSETPAGEPGP